MTNLIDLTNRSFARLTVLSRAENGSGGKARWNCVCTCGSKTVVRGENLKTGAVKSCGCLLFEASQSKTHGKHRTSEYNSWCSMKGRCFNKANSKYPRYGGRGITVCARWLLFENFIADMGSKPTPKHTLERLNNDGHYEPNNCVWATVSTQSNNQSRTKYYDFQGRKVKVVELALIAGITHSAMYQRLVHHKGDVKAALNPKNVWNCK